MNQDRSQTVIRTVRPADREACIRIETACFPPEEAADAQAIEKRIRTFPQGFLVAEYDGQVVGQINSGATDKQDITDEAFKQLIGHDANGRNMVIFSLSVHPDYQRRGIAGELLRAFIQSSREQERSAILLLCKSELVPYYQRFGFCDRGLSASEHGGTEWHEMACSLRGKNE